jgi:hypothetical protein
LVPRADKKRAGGFSLPDWLAWPLLVRRTTEWASVAAAVVLAGVFGFAIGQHMHANSRTISLLVSSELSFDLGEPPQGLFVIEDSEFPARGDA